MKDKKETGIKGDNKKSLIFYLNDDNTSTSAFVEIVEIGDFVIFKTNDNLIKIPSNRILKIKERLQNG